MITVDALHCQRDHVAYLAERGAHWILTVKANRPTCTPNSPAYLAGRSRRHPPRRSRARSPRDSHVQDPDDLRRYRLPARGPGHPGPPAATTPR
ncbi:hypothetical protein [Micromonospora aurantiaca (nom. illeg.)]|uniref:hypothetical protein n=1 Tax=Micromonospora aurantiaca (nom. illeg.) TaxID=47850 RepID=UPI0033D481FC